MRKYSIIAKYGNNPDKSAKTVKYRNVTNLVRLAEYLDKHFPTWTWCNVYDMATKQQLSNFTKHNRPLKPQI